MFSDTHKSNMACKLEHCNNTPSEKRMKGKPRQPLICNNDLILLVRRNQASFSQVDQVMQTDDRELTLRIKNYSSRPGLWLLQQNNQLKNLVGFQPSKFCYLP